MIGLGKVYVTIIISGLITDCVLEVQVPAEVLLRRIAPQQFCIVGFRVKDDDLEKIKSILREICFSFRCLGKM